MCVVLHPKAERDLSELYLYIAGQGSPLAAKAYVDRIVAQCAALSTFPQRGASRPDLGPAFVSSDSSEGQASFSRSVTMPSSSEVFSTQAGF